MLVLSKTAARGLCVHVYRQQNGRLKCVSELVCDSLKFVLQYIGRIF